MNFRTASILRTALIVARTLAIAIPVAFVAHVVALAV